jgi:imidazolonepropionase-like amidohydrolase
MPRRIFRRCVCASLVIVAACAIIALVFAPACQAQGGEPRYFAIKNARIVPVSGPVIENGTVVIANGLIKAIGADAPIPPEAWVIDGKGLTVYPGLIDAMSELAPVAAEPATQGPAGRGARRRAVPTEVAKGPEDRPGTTPWVVAADEVRPDEKRFETWRNAGFTSALAVPKGAIFPGQGSVINFAGERAGDLVVKSPVTLDVSLQPIGGFFSFPGSLMGVIAYVHQVFIDAASYGQAETIYDAHARGLERPKYDRTERVVRDAQRNKELVLLSANSEIQLRRALRLTQEWGLGAGFYGGQQGYAVASLIAEQNVPVLVSLKWPERPKDADPEADTPLRELRFRDRAPSTPAAFAKAGVKFAFYSDGIASPKEVLKNAKKAIDAGLAPEAALRAFTLGAAEIIGVNDRLGSIEPGKIANLVVADGDLFSEKTKVKYVFVDGQRFEVREAERPKESPKGNVTGRWTLSYTTPEGPEEGTADLTMSSDGTLSGTFSSPRGTQTLSDGWVSGNSFHFVITIPLDQGPADVTVSGTFEGNTMKGTISVSGFLIDFTGTKPGGAGKLAAARN